MIAMGRPSPSRSTAHDLEPVDTGQHEVEKHEIRVPLARGGERTDRHRL